MGHSEGSPERKIHSNIGLPKEDTKISDKQSNPTSKELEQRNNNKQSLVSRRKEIIKIRAELNVTETEKQFKGSMNPGAASLKRFKKWTNL